MRSEIVAEIKSTLQKSVVERLFGGPIPEDQRELTRREAQVLALLARGYTTQRIAELLEVKPRSVLCTRQKVHRKLGAHTGAHAVYLGCQRGYLAVHER